MTQEEMRNEFYALYEMMADSNNVAYMRIFGDVHKEMMDWFIQNKPELAHEWVYKLESIRWRNYLTPREAEKIVSGMEPKAPWSKEQWKSAMEQHGLPLEKEPFYNRCAMWVTMNMIMSDSSETLGKFVDEENMFHLVHDLAVDKLTDKDGVFNVKRYFGM